MTPCHRNPMLAARPAESAPPRASVRWMRRLAPACAAILLATAGVRAQPIVLLDHADDARALWTDRDGNGPFNAAEHVLPDILEMRLGAFAPAYPAADRFQGNWNPAGLFMRLDIVLAGVICPPGPLSYAKINPVYDPFKYGPNCMYGFFELDIDADEQTGGELDAPYYRYTGVAARAGGLPAAPRLAGRVAEDYYAFDGDVTTPPFVDRSGEEFHLALYQEQFTRIDVRRERPGGDPDRFEAGEIWDITGDVFHRAHGYDGFTFMCFNAPGAYRPEVMIRYAHDEATDRTTISLVYPLTNDGSAALLGPGTTVEPDDGCHANQNSIREALEDLRFSAMYADPVTRAMPEFQLIAGWANRTPAAYLDPTGWRVLANVATAYEWREPGGARYIWTDVHPDVRNGDFNGDGLLDGDDRKRLKEFIARHDGDPMYDDDGDPNNGVIDLYLYAWYFSLFDTDYDGFISVADAVVPGDMDRNLIVDVDDVDDFVLALIDPAAYRASNAGIDPRTRGDMNADGRLDGDDMALFIARVLAGP